MKVIIIRGRAIDPAVNKMAKALAQNGYKVTLLVWDRQHTLINSDGEGYAIRRFTLRAPYDRLTVLFYLPFWSLYEFFFLLRNKCDVVHSCDLDTLISALLVKAIKKIKLCYTIYDFYASNLPDGRCPLLRKFIRNLVASIEKFGIRFTDVLFLVDESRLEQVAGARIKRLVYIYNSPPDYFAAGRKFETMSASGPSILTVFYAGAIHNSRGLAHVIKAMEDMEDVTLVVAGTGPAKKVIEKACRRCQRIHYLGQILYDEVIERTMAADILFALYDTRIPANRYASPNKLFEAMMCAKPIIVNDGCSMTNIVKKENCGLIVPYGDIEAIKAAILELKNSPQLRRRLGQNGRMAYEKKYRWEIMAGRLVDAYREIEREKYSPSYACTHSRKRTV